MREARIILPRFDNDDVALTEVHTWLRRQLAGAFNGFTAADADGYWLGEKYTVYSERVTFYDVAMAPTGSNDLILRNVARVCGIMAKQQAVYVRYASGDVDIIDLTEEIAAAA